MQKRRAKIVATIGPATLSEKTLSRLISVGADIIRLNFSHGDQKGHGEAIARIRRIEKAMAKPVAIIQDLQGPKVRIGPLKEPSYRLKKNATITILNSPCVGDATAVSSDYPLLYQKVKPSDTILINDGQIVLKVLTIQQKNISCRVLEGGILSPHKGVNVPGRELGFPTLTPKDRSDLAFGLKHGVDYVALSMVRTKEDVLAVKRFIKKAGQSTPVIAKLEQAMAIEHLDGIMESADGVMVARGDLGVEIPLEKVPLLQKKIIKLANQAQIPVITATQMLESMITNTRPTRAEVSDVANAILDGSDAVMLSGETASGKHPIKSVQMMARIISEAEAPMASPDRPLEKKIPLPEAVSRAACRLASQMDAQAIVTSTLSGGSALRLSKYRPIIPIIAFTPNPQIKRRMLLYWGVTPLEMSLLKKSDDIFQEMASGIQSAKLAKKGQLLVMTSQSPRNQEQSKGGSPADLIKVHQMES